MSVPLTPQMRSAVAASGIQRPWVAVLCPGGSYASARQPVMMPATPRYCAGARTSSRKTRAHRAVSAGYAADKVPTSDTGPETSDWEEKIQATAASTSERRQQRGAEGIAGESNEGFRAEHE